MHQDYHCVAMLDPAELAGGMDPQTGRTVAGLDLDPLCELEHDGQLRAALRVLTLLRTRRIDALEYADNLEHVLPAHPDAYRVRLDVGTGVCVPTEEVGGSTPGKGHDLRIEAVDEPMDDDVFVRPRRLGRRLTASSGGSPRAIEG